jgi:rod shape-determining protein MreC
MRNLIDFLIRYSNFLIFTILEVVAFILICVTHDYQHSTVWSSANRIVAGSNQIKTSISDYLCLRKDNMDLAVENAQLRDYITKLQNEIESTVERDSQYVYSHLDWEYIPAKVIDISTNKQHNYLTLNKGSRDGIEKDMGVISADGVVGIVSATSEKYSLVVPLIHTKISISSRIKRNGQIGGTMWKGRDYTKLELTHIARHITVEEGDSVVTSGLTSVFPEGLLIGTIQHTELNPSADYHSATIEIGVDYRALKYVQVLHNKNKEYYKNIYDGMD